VRTRAEHWVVRLGAVAALISTATVARAQLLGGLTPSYDPDDPYQLPDAPAPPTLPDLTHRGLGVSMETTLASVKPNLAADGRQPSRVGVWLERLETELAVSNRRWYLGLAQEVAGGRTPQGGTGVVMGNPELWGRALWASRAGLAYGGGLGFVPPIVRHDPDSAEANIQSTVRIVRPWDFPHFADRTLTFRPFIDVRDIDGPVMLQLRQGIDVTLLTSDVTSLTPHTTLTSRTAFYMGYRPVDLLGLGLELSETYFIKASGVADDQRAVFAVSPCVRWMGEVVQPAASMIFPIDRPLFNSAQSYWAVRLTFALILDPGGRAVAQ
jgi:hypothetical protein